MAKLIEVVDGRSGHPEDNAWRGMLDCLAIFFGVFIATSPGFELPGIAVVLVVSGELCRKLVLTAFNPPIEDM